MGSRRGDGNMIWIVVTAVLALVFLSGGTLWASDFFKGAKADTDALTACEGLAGELAGGTAYCFENRDCTGSKTSKTGIAIPNGKWIFIGEKGCRDINPEKPNCCLLRAVKGDLNMEATLQRSCSQMLPGEVAFISGGICQKISSGTEISFSSQYTELRYYKTAQDPSTGQYKLHLSLQPKEPKDANQLIVSFQLSPSQDGAYLEFIIPTQMIESDDKTRWTFLSYLKRLPDINGRDLSHLNSGAMAKITVSKPDASQNVVIDRLNVPIQNPKICSLNSPGDVCQNSPAGLKQERSYGGVLARTNCVLEEKTNLCTARVEYSPSSVTCNEKSEDSSFFGRCNDLTIDLNEGLKCKRIRPGLEKDVVCEFSKKEQDIVYCKVTSPTEGEAGLPDCGESS